MNVGELKKILSSINDGVDLAVRLPYCKSAEDDKSYNQYGRIVTAETMWIDHYLADHSKSSWDLARKHPKEHDEECAFSKMSFCLLFEYEV